MSTSVDSSPSRPGPSVDGSRPTVVLVHGALTDASVWSGVTRLLQREGLRVVVPSLPLRSLAGDVAALAAVLDRLEGPLVLVGHSYGGTVLSHPRIARSGVRALVYVAAFQPEPGESTGALNTLHPGSRFDASTAVIEAYPGGDEISLRPEAFASVYAGDLDAETTAVLAASQRPIDVRALTETFDGEPAWRTAPSWVLVATQDQSLPAVTQRFMAARAASQVVEIDASHAAPLSRPDAVAGLVLRAARELGLSRSSMHRLESGERAAAALELR